MSEPPQPWIIEDFIAPGTWTEIIGRMKEGKSTFVYAMLRAVLAGDTFLGRETKRTKALLLTEQTGMSLRATLERADLVRADDLSILTVSDIHGHTWPEVVAAATIIAKNRGAGIIVVDTLARLAQIADEDEARSVNVLYPFVAAKALGIATVFVRHSRKSGGPLNVAARGSGAITGEMDICVGITAPQGPSSDYRNVELISRLTGMDELHLDYNDGDFTLLAEPPKRGSKKPNRILDALSAAPMQTQSVTELLQKTGMKNRTLFYHLKLLRDSGAIRQVEQSSGRERSYTLNPAAAVIVDAATKGQDD